jgi:hypothetical protein
MRNRREAPVSHHQLSLASAAGASKPGVKNQKGHPIRVPMYFKPHSLPSMPEDNTETYGDPGGEYQGQKLEQAITRDNYSLVERYSLRATGSMIVLLSLLHAFSPLPLEKLLLTTFYHIYALRWHLVAV